MQIQTKETQKAADGRGEAVPRARGGGGDDGVRRWGDGAAGGVEAEGAVGAGEDEGLQDATGGSRRSLTFLRAPLLT